MEAAVSDSISKMDEIAIEIREVPCSGSEHQVICKSLRWQACKMSPTRDHSGPGYLARDTPVQYSIPTTSASLVFYLGHCPNFHLRGFWTVVGFPIAQVALESGG
jgi:hypothetical protein